MSTYNEKFCQVVVYLEKIRERIPVDRDEENVQRRKQKNLVRMFPQIQKEISELREALSATGIPKDEVDSIGSEFTDRKKGEVLKVNKDSVEQSLRRLYFRVFKYINPREQEGGTNQVEPTGCQYGFHDDDCLLIGGELD